MTLGSLFDGIGGFPLAAGVKHWLVAPYAQSGLRDLVGQQAMKFKT